MSNQPAHSQDNQCSGSDEKFQFSETDTTPDCYETLPFHLSTNDDRQFGDVGAHRHRRYDYSDPTIELLACAPWCQQLSDPHMPLTTQRFPTANIFQHYPPMTAGFTSQPPPQTLTTLNSSTLPIAVILTTPTPGRYTVKCTSPRCGKTFNRQYDFYRHYNGTHNMAEVHWCPENFCHRNEVYGDQPFPRRDKVSSDNKG
ncbi:hypothetical protein T440DRAFT_476007 [Plenodomus tracheiphilus IPT5]|uniref:C2H2-type domain-containing protein n=1 Tax=Plenodomus tracheiphilus IPT5 TaxID=1408161 RepID=A0A6A7BF64_9PLEO|nr:hypothetical protein T440DRAFT_476007 [Plenodomus tracheiphilus IPT5]